jgi:beta-lactamase class D
MLNFFYSLIHLILIHTFLFGSNDCFFAKENNLIVVNEGDCQLRHSPHSTFKIVISLMGFNEGILIDEKTPEWEFKNGYIDFLDRWKQPYNPSLWMKNSCIWYSQLITQKIGMEKFQDYVTKFNYGNQDVSGDKDEHNGLTYSWLSSSLQISPQEQVEFLQAFLDKKLPVSSQSYDMTKKLLFMEDLKDGWKIYGKTGWALPKNGDGTKDDGKQFGWFIGWVSNGERNIVFAHCIEKDNHPGVNTPQEAKETAKEKMNLIINNEGKQ